MTDTLDAVDQAIRLLTSDTQPHHVDAGLLQVGREIVQASFDDALYGTEDDDDD